MMNSVEELLAQLPVIEDKLNYSFLNKQLLILSFVHRSFYN